MGCNTKKSYEVDFSSVAGTIATIELATGLNYTYPEYLEESLAGVNDPLTVIPSIRYGVESLNNSVTLLYNSILNNELYSPIIPDTYPNLYNRISQSPISYTELADILDYYNYTSTNYFDNKVANNEQQVLKELDEYYEEEMSGESVSLCSLLDNPFVGIAAGLLENLSSGNFLDFLPSIASRLKQFAESIKERVEQVFENMKNLVGNLADSANNIAQNLAKIPAAFAGIQAAMSKKFEALKNMLSEINKENLKEAIDKFVTKAALQFKKLIENPQVILYLLYMFCKTSSFVEKAIKNPVFAMQSMLQGMEHEQNVLRIKSAPMTQRAIQAGRKTATENYTNQVRQQRATTHNNSVSNEIQNKPDEISENTKYVYTPQYTNHPDPNSWSNLSFEATVINNSFWKKDINVRMDNGSVMNPKNMGLGVDIGYTGCQLQVLEMLNEVGKMLGKKLRVTSAFRHPVYNQYLRNQGHHTAKKSNHMKGIALDVLMGGVDRNAFVAAAKKVGFRGFGYYSSFIHVDTGNARTWRG